MKKFIRKSTTFSLILIILAVLIDKAVSYYLKQSNQYMGEFEVWNDIYDGNATCDIAIYGSSRAWVQFSPQILTDSLNESVYNLGIDGHNFWLQYLRHLEYLKHNPKPKAILMSIDIFSLQKRKDLYQMDQFLPYMLWNKDIRKLTSSYEGFNSADYYFPLVRYYGKNKVLSTCISVILNNDGNTEYRNHGYRAMDKPWNNDFDKAKETMKGYEIDLDSASINLFSEFILECKKSNIELVLVYAPEYIEGQKFVLNRSDILNIYADLANQHNLLFLDYSNSKISFNKSLFYNTQHLNAKGATLFTKILAGDLKKAHIKTKL